MMERQINTHIGKVLAIGSKELIPVVKRYPAALSDI